MNELQLKRLLFEDIIMLSILTELRLMIINPQLSYSKKSKLIFDILKSEKPVKSN